MVSDSNPRNADGRLVLLAAIEDPAEQEAEFLELSKAADTLIEHSKLGAYGKFFSPFTKQFKQSIRESYPTDKETFDETDRNENNAIFKALYMRLITFTIFTAWSVVVWLLITARLDVAENGTKIEWIDFSFFALAAIVAYALRYCTRYVLLSQIGGEATLFANYFFKQLTNIHDRAINAVRASNDDMMLSSAWPDRSAGWIKIALWQGKRYENLDRFVTATAWRVESRYYIIEATFQWAKAIVISVVIAASLPKILDGHNTPANFAPSMSELALYLVMAFGAWGLLTRTSNAYWAEKFRPSITGFDEQKEHIHIQISKVVAGDKRLIMSDKRNVGREKPG